MAGMGLVRALALGAAASICYMAAAGTPVAARVVGTRTALVGGYDRTVATAAELRQAIADIGTLLPQGAKIGVTADIDLGGTNRATGGFTDTTLYIINKSCTIEPVPGYGSYDVNPMGDGNSYVQRFARTITIKGFVTAYATGTRRTFIFRGFRRTLDTFPALGDNTSGQTWWDVGCTYREDGSVENANNTTFALDTIVGNVDFVYGCNETFMGSDINHTPLDPRIRAIDSNSPASWQFRSDGGIVAAGGTNATGTVYAGHGDAIWVRYNRLISGPRGLYVNKWSGGSGDISANYFRDLMTGYKFFATGGGSRQDLVVHHNEFDRNYTDHSQGSQDEFSKVVVKRWGNVYGRGIGNSRNNANPHGDDDQWYMAQATAVLKRVAHHRTWGEVRWADKDDLRSGAAMYYQGGSPKYEQVGWEAHHIVAMNRTKMFAMSSGRGSLLRHLVGINQDGTRTNDSNAPGAGNIQMERGSDGSGNALPDSLSLVQNVIHEGFYKAAGGKFARQFVRSNYRDYPKAQSAGRAATMAAEFLNLERAINTPNDAFLAATEKAVGSSGIDTGFASMADLLDAAQPDYAWLGFPVSVDLDLNTQYQVDAYVHGIEGSARAITAIAAGLEAKAIDVFTDADITTYGTADFGTHAGEVIRVRFTTPNTELTEVTKTITHNGAPVNITYATKATTLYSLAHFTNANLTKSGGIGSADTTKMSMYFDFVFKQNKPAATVLAQQVFIVSTGTNITCSVTNADALTLLMRVSGASMAQFTLNTNSFVDGQRYQIHVAIDTSQDDVIDAVRVWVNNVEVSAFNTRVHSKNGLLKFGLSSTWSLFNTSGSTLPFIGDLGALIIWPGVAYDWSDFNVRKKTSPLLIGSNGSGIDGTAAKIFIRGDVTKINGASTANDGSGGAFDNIGADVT